ncbi:MAG: hypothetical protein RL477_1695, partial [Pseudomonadota bacterium]
EPAAKELASHRTIIPRLGLGARLRNYFLTGVLVTTPIGITIYLAWIVVRFVDSRADRLVPPEYNPGTYLPISVPGLGLLLFIVLLTLIGMLTTGYVGRLFTRAVDGAVARVPFLRSVYGATKQILETLMSGKSSFREVVLIEFPRLGQWSVAFVTGSVKSDLPGVDDELVNVFIPTTPNPTNGFLIFVPRRDLVPLDISVEAGVKLVISGGIVSPERLKVRAPASADAAARGPIASTSPKVS